LLDQMPQPLRLQPGQFLGMRVVEPEQRLAQRLTLRNFGCSYRLQRSITHASFAERGRAA
jgi:hypothetical protein